MNFLSLHSQTQDTPLTPAFIKIPHKKSPRVTSTGAIFQPQIQIFYLYFHFFMDIIRQIAYNCYTFLVGGYSSLTQIFTERTGNATTLIGKTTTALRSANTHWNGNGR